MSKPHDVARLRRTGFLTAAALVSAAALLLTGQPGCMVEERCYGDSDCERPNVCGADGRCEFQCRVDSDCDRPCGVECVCDENHCVHPVACTLCAFVHARASCVHGVCSMEACNEGFYDANQDVSDGCEYECTPSNDGVEACDERDNDCDGETDEDTNLDADPVNCGQCGNVCPAPPHADRVCASGQCVYVCHDGWYDNNGLAEDGCEGTECVAAEEVCDGRDNDCDCPGDTNGDGDPCGPGDEGVDEGFDKTLVESCGPFCAICAYAHAEALCVDGACEMGQCDTGWHDADGRASTGCEYECTPTGEELCDGADNDCDGDVDEGGVCGALCPDDMVSVGTIFCIDKYEASRPDATAIYPGTDESVATSRVGVLPWMVNPMSDAHFERFQAACQAAGKHLCTKEEWFATCAGSEQNTYVYGNVFDKETCNCVDTYCDDYCAANGISPGQCQTGANCGYTYDCFRETPTGQFPDCTNEYGTLDINGNLWEIVPSSEDSRGYEVRGGAFNCASASTRVSCSFNASWTALYAGFRCCKDAS